MVDNEHWGTINNPQNLALKVEGEWGSRAWCTICNSSSSSSLPSKYVSWGLTLHFFWLGKDHDHISSCMLLSYFCLFCSSPGVLMSMLSWSRRYTRSEEKNLLVVDVLNYVHVHHGQDSKMFTLCWVKAPPPDQEEDSGLPLPCTYSKHEEELCSVCFGSGNKNEKRRIPHLSPTLLIFITRLILLCKIQDTKYFLNFWPLKSVLLDCQ